MKTKKKKRRKRLEPLARIRRRLMRLWTARVGEDWKHVCAVCGSASTPNAHHLENRNTCRILRYDPMNGILLCPSHHKFGKDSAHKGGLWFADWLRRNHPDRLEYVLAHRNDEINLNDRETLAKIEAYLKAPQPADSEHEQQKEVKNEDTENMGSGHSSLGDNCGGVQGCPGDQLQA